MKKNTKNSIHVMFTMLFTSLILVTFLFACSTSPKKPTTQLGNFINDVHSSLQKRGLEKTLSMFESVPAGLKDDFTVDYLHASLLFSAREYDKSEEIAQKLSAKDPKNTDLMYLQVMLAKAKGDTAKKNNIIKEILAADPKNTDANVELANDQMIRKNFGLAKKYYQTALESDPTNINAMLGLGQSSYYTDDLKTAKSVLTKMTEVYPDESIGWFFLAKLAGDDENYLQAGKLVEKALKLDDSYYDYWSDYGIYLRYQGRPKDAEKAWSKAIELNDTAFYAYIHRASLYDERGELDKALADYMRIIELNPDYPYSYESVGMIYWHKGEWAKSRNFFNHVYKLNPNNVSYPLMISATYLREKKTRENKDFMRKVYAKFPLTSIEYAMTRLYYDSLNPAIVEKKLSEVTSAYLKGKMHFYMGLFYDINNNDVGAREQYLIVKNIQAPMFFEYRLNDWQLEKMMN